MIDFYEDMPKTVLAIACVNVADFEGAIYYFEQAIQTDEIFTGHADYHDASIKLWSDIHWGTEPDNYRLYDRHMWQ